MRPLPTLLALALFASTAAAGSVPVVFEGHVVFNSLASGPFAGVPNGASAVLSFEAITPGVVLSPNQYETYTIDLASFTLEVGGVESGASPAMGGPSYGIANNYPVADGMFLFQHPLAISGHAFECELHDSTGTALGSIDATQIAGSYPGSLWDSVDWNVFGPGGQMAIVLDNVTVHPDVSLPIGTGYCASNPNSSGLPAVVSASGCTSMAINDVTLHADQLPANKSVLFFYGPNAVQLPFGQGFLCVSGGITRMPVGNSGAGSYSRPLDLDAGPGLITAGSTWRFQSWFRDVGGTTNTSDAVSITFTP